MKKFPLLLLCFFIPTIINASPNTENTDVKENKKNDNTGDIAVQKVINKEINPELPNTDEKTAFVPNIKSRDKEGWGEKQHQTFTAKKFTLFKENNPKRPGGNGEFYNCPISADKKYCQPVKGQLNKDVGVILRQSKPTLDSDGFITDLQPPVLYDQGSKSVFEKYFYRFWNTNKTECDHVNQSCWSPAYPVICNHNFISIIDPKTNETGAQKFAKLGNYKNGDLQARHYFGWREKLGNDINSYTTENDYKIHVYMAPIKKDEDNFEFEDNSKGIFTALSPTGWIKKDNCLDPEFDYDLEQNDSNGNTTTEVLTLDDEISSLSEPKSIKIGGQILPCGNFSNNTGYKNKSFKDIAIQHCSMNDEGNDPDKTYYYSIKDTLDYNYDQYAIHLPLSGKFTDINSLNQRSNYDYKVILANKDNKHKESKKMKTRICGTCKKIDSVCDEIVRSILYEKQCEPIGNKFNCKLKQVEDVIFTLKFNKGNFTGKTAENKVSGYTKKQLECQICLWNLDKTLEGLINNIKIN